MSSLGNNCNHISAYHYSLLMKLFNVFIFTCHIEYDACMYTHAHTHQNTVCTCYTISDSYLLKDGLCLVQNGYPGPIIPFHEGKAKFIRKLL